MARLKTVLHRRGWRIPSTPTDAQQTALNTQQARDRAYFEQGFNAGVIEGAKLMKEQMMSAVSDLANTAPPRGTIITNGPPNVAP